MPFGRNSVEMLKFAITIMDTPHLFTTITLEIINKYILKDNIKTPNLASIAILFLELVNESSLWYSLLIDYRYSYYFDLDVMCFYLIHFGVKPKLQLSPTLEDGYKK